VTGNVLLFVISAQSLFVRQWFSRGNKSCNVYLCQFFCNLTINMRETVVSNCEKAFLLKAILEGKVSQYQYCVDMFGTKQHFRLVGSKFGDCIFQIMLLFLQIDSSIGLALFACHSTNCICYSKAAFSYINL